MTGFDLIEEVRRRPFLPFRMLVSDGSIYEVRHPEMCMVGAGSVILGITSEPNSYMFERTVRLALSHIVRIEHIVPITPPNPPTMELTA